MRRLGVIAAALIRTKIATVARLASQVAPGMTERDAGHHGEDHGGDRACRQRVDRRSDRNAGTRIERPRSATPTTIQA